MNSLSYFFIMKKMTNVNATKLGLISCLEPVYAILIAYFWIDEIPAFGTILGGLIILSVVFIESIKHNFVKEEVLI